MPGRMWGREKSRSAGKGRDEAAPGQWQEGPDPQAAPRTGLLGVAAQGLAFLEEGAPAAQQSGAARLEEAERPSPSREDLCAAGDGEVMILLAGSPARPFGPSSPVLLGSENPWSEVAEKKEDVFLGPCHPPGEGGGGEVLQEEPAGPSVASPPPKRGRSSSDGSMVWDHFELCPDDPTTAICIRCRAQVSRGKDPKRLSTSGMLKHLRRHHPEAHAPAATTRLSVPSAGSKAPASRQGPLPAQWVWSAGSQSERPKPHLITQAIAEMVALDDQPFQGVENAGFHRLLRLLAPDYQLPSWATFSRQVVPSLYQACKEAVSGLLHTAVPDTSVHFTANMWTSSSGPHAFLMSLTAHWWGQENEGMPAAGGMTSPSQSASHRWALLHVEALDIDHTADELSVAVGHQVEGWLSRHPNLRRGFMVTNGAPNLARVAEQLQFVSIPCVVHTLNLVVQEALGFSGAAARQEAPAEGAAGPPSDAAVAVLVDKCRRIGGYFHRSEKGRRMLKERQLELGLPEHPIPQDVPACWNSTFLLLQRLLEQELAIYCLARRHGLEVCDLSTQDWALISEVVLTLEPFFVATNSLCAETATLSQALPTALLLEKTMGELQSVLTTDEAVALAARLKTGVVDQLREPLGRSAEHVLSCLCDPRMKGKAVTPDQLPRWRALLVEEVRQVQERRLGCKQEEGAGAPASSGLSTSSSSSGSSVTALASQPSGTMPLASPRELLVLPLHSARWFTEGFLGALPGVREEPTEPCSSAERCVLQYLQEPVAGWEMEPIQFWATHHQVWPDLATVAERFLSCPPSSVQRERVFSMAADGVTPYSLRLETELVEQLVFLKANLPLLGYPELALESGE